jgi:hypothetical protein
VSSIATDLKAGVRTAWAASSSLIAVIPVASLYSGSVPGLPQPPYAALATDALGDDFSAPAVPGAKFITKQRLTVRVWASGDDAESAVGPIVPLVQAVLGNESWTVANSTLTASYQDEINQVEDGQYGGNQVWRADVPFEVWLERTLP